MEPQSPNSSYFISTKRTRIYLSRSAEASADAQLRVLLGASVLVVAIIACLVHARLSNSP